MSRRTERSDRWDAQLLMSSKMATVERNSPLYMAYFAAGTALEKLRKNSTRSGAAKHAIFKRIMAEVRMNETAADGGAHTSGATGVDAV